MNPRPAAGTVLVVEDDPNTARLVATYLERDGYDTVLAADGLAALRLHRRHRPVLIILDIMLPELDGWEVCRTLRRESDVPILILSAREEEVDRVAGLSLGADDYVVKPFSPRELVERVKAILRRARPGPPRRRGGLAVGELTLDAESHRVAVGGKPVSLTSSEFKLLQALMNAPGRVFSRDELLGALYETGQAVVDRVVDVHIGKIRQKIETDPAKPRYIQTVRGFGYRMADDERE
jgi:DNA-binding response OmpR family regulator